MQPQPAKVVLRISVVLPTYNRAKLISETLDAILAQTLAPFEIIVVDDGSTDGTAEVLAAYAATIRTIRIANSGELVARNAGLAVASGDLVAFCDSDDLWRPNRLAQVVQLWTAAPEIQFAYGEFLIVRNGFWGDIGKFSSAPSGYWDGVRRVGDDMGVFDAPIIEHLIKFQPFFPSTLVVRREFFDRLGGWDEGVTGLVGCDFATVLRLCEHAPFGVLFAASVGIRKHEGNFSADVQAMNLGDSKVLEYALKTRGSLARYAGAFKASMDRRRADALHSAFASLDFATVRDTFTLISPAARKLDIRFKHWIATQPMPLGRLLATSLIQLRHFSKLSSVSEGCRQHRS